MSWKQPECSGDIPCPRAAFASTQIGIKGYLFGGSYQEIRRNDLYVTDMECYTWSIVEPRSRLCPQGQAIMDSCDSCQ